MESTQKERSILELYYDEGLSDRELGELFGGSRSSAQRERTRVLAKVRRQLLAQGLDPESLIAPLS